MKNIQEVWVRIQETKKEQRSIKAMYRDALENSKEYQELLEKLENIKRRKKELENMTKAEMGDDGVKLSTIKLHLKTDKEMLTDIAISNLMKGETVKVTDADNLEYEPIFSVKFVKTNVISQKNS